MRICGSKIGNFGGIFGILLEFVLRIYVIFDVLAPTTPHNHDEYPPKRKRGAELSVGRRTAMAVETALAIPPGKTRVPKGILGPLVERYGGVGPGYPKKHWSECIAQINETGELDLSNKRRSGRPSLLPTVRGVR